MTGVAIKVLGTAIVIAICVLCALFILNRFENPTSEFANYADMATSESMAGGWIPNVIPRSAYDISETHNLDNNRVHISFSFEPGDTDVADSTCAPPEEQQGELIFNCSDGKLRLAKDGQGHFASY